MKFETTKKIIEHTLILDDNEMWALCCLALNFKKKLFNEKYSWISSLEEMVKDLIEKKEELFGQKTQI